MARGLARAPSDRKAVADVFDARRRHRPGGLTSADRKTLATADFISLFQYLMRSSESVTGINVGINRFGESHHRQDATRHKNVPSQAQGAKQDKRGVMLKTVYAIFAAALIAAALVAFPSLSPQVEARSVVQGAKADRADARPLANQCSQYGWPYFEAACMRDTRNAYAEARPVRLVSSDRPILSQAKPAR